MTLSKRDTVGLAMDFSSFTRVCPREEISSNEVWALDAFASEHSRPSVVHERTRSSHEYLLQCRIPFCENHCILQSLHCIRLSQDKLSNILLGPHVSDHPCSLLLCMPRHYPVITNRY